MIGPARASNLDSLITVTRQRIPWRYQQRHRGRHPCRALIALLTFILCCQLSVDVILKFFLQVSKYKVYKAAEAVGRWTAKHIRYNRSCGKGKSRHRMGWSQHLGQRRYPLSKMDQRIDRNSQAGYSRTHDEQRCGTYTLSHLYDALFSATATSCREKQNRKSFQQRQQMLPLLPKRQQ